MTTKSISLIVITTILFSLGGNTSAQTTGALDGLMLEQLIQNGKTAYDTLKKASEQYERIKKMEAIQAAKTVRKMYRDGRELQDMFKNAKALAGKIEGIEMDEFESMFNGKSADWFISQYKNIHNNPNKKKAYGSLAMKISNLKFLYASNEATVKDKAAGTNEEDNTRLTATNSIIMSKILLDQEAREINKQKNNTDIVNSVLSGSAGYSSLAESDSKKKSKASRFNK